MPILSPFLKIYNGFFFTFFISNLKWIFLNLKKSNLRLHSLHLKFIYFVCTKLVFLLESKMALFSFERYFGMSKDSFPHFKLFVVSKIWFSRQTLNCIRCIQHLYWWIYPLFIWFVCTKVVFSLQSKMALFTF